MNKVAKADIHLHVNPSIPELTTKPDTHAFVIGVLFDSLRLDGFRVKLKSVIHAIDCADIANNGSQIVR